MKVTFKETENKTVESNIIKDDEKRKRIAERVNKFINRPEQSPQSKASPTEFSASIGIQVKTLRESLGLGVRDFSKKVGIAYPNVCYIEQGKAACNIRTLSKIADATGKKIEIKFV